MITKRQKRVLNREFLEFRKLVRQRADLFNPLFLSFFNYFVDYSRMNYVDYIRLLSFFKKINHQFRRLKT